MKTFLIVAGLLMTGASVYGVVDYNKKADYKEFKELYKEKPGPVETEFVKEETPVTAVEKKEVLKDEDLKKTENVPVKKEVKKKAKKEKEERKFRMKEFSRGKLG